MEALTRVRVSNVRNHERMRLQFCLPTFGMCSPFLQAEEVQPRLSRGKMSFCTHVPCREFSLHHNLSDFSGVILHESIPGQAPALVGYFSCTAQSFCVQQST